MAKQPAPSGRRLGSGGRAHCVDSRKASKAEGARRRAGTHEGLEAAQGGDARRGIGGVPHGGGRA
eukprot:scaffold280409_cov15-Prasinocladus_malaysianus.AAC.1